ncbi:MAG: hypothetical protein OHK005_14420 [Candidatus Methylacidiphilales bacterium]
MRAEVELRHEPLETLPLPSFIIDGSCGAVVTFTGTVRSEEADHPISALIYEAYEPMAHRQILHLLNDLAHRYPVRAVHLRHRLGTIPVGAAAIVLRVESVHRAEAFAFATTFMDRFKQDVPIWKTGSLP